MSELEDPIKSPSTSTSSNANEAVGMEGASQEAPEFKATANSSGSMPEEEPVEL